MVLRWGICCSGKISQDFSSALQEFGNSSHKIVAIAARDKDRSRIFAERFKIENYFDSYQKLAEFRDIDIVYIGSIHPEHCKLTKLFLNHGKHVLVEKPMAMNSAETKEMIDLAKEKKLFLMEGVWSLCFPLYKRIQELVLSGSIGHLRHVNANFQVNIEKVDRLAIKELGGGAILDIGIYAIQFALWIFKGRKLINATSDLRFKNGVDIFGTVILEFDDNGTAFLTIHTGLNGNTSASIYGESGHIMIPTSMWSPEEFIINGKLDQSHKLERKNVSFKYNFPNSWYFIYEIDHVYDCIKNGLLESDIHPLHASMKLAEIMEKLISN